MACGRTPPPAGGAGVCSCSSQDRQNPAALHCNLIKTGSVARSLYNNLITLYSRSPTTLPSALRLFRHLPFRPNLASWTAVISSHVTHAPAASLDLFLLMLRSTTFPPASAPHNLQRAVASVLRACCAAAAPRFLALTHQLHTFSLKLSVSHLPFTGSALVSAYSKLGYAADAFRVFDGIADKDEVCYGAAIMGLAQNRQPEDAIRVFLTMRHDGGVPSNMYTVSGALRAAADMSALEQSRGIHGHAVVVGLHRGVVVGTALVNAYGKAGLVSDARAMFDEVVDVANVFTWNTMLAAYAQQGDPVSAVGLFEQMKRRYGIDIDGLTLLAVMTAYSNIGMVEDVRMYLESMSKDYGLTPGIKHFTSLIGALARLGRVEEAHQVALSMPCKPDAAVWRTLLAASVIHRDTDIAEAAGRCLLELYPQDESAHVMLANVYAQTGEKTKSNLVQKQMSSLKLREGSRSWVEVCGIVHVFPAGKNTKAWWRVEVLSRLEELMEGIRELGYLEPPDKSIRYHSEKLALAFALLNNGKSVPRLKMIRIVKNLRICEDCHEAFKFLSMLLEREILVRDAHRFHRFIEGSCSCRGTW